MLMATIRCFGQDSIASEIVLVVKKAVLKKGQIDSIDAIYQIGQRRIAVEDSNYNVARGRIQAISDSSVTLKGKTFKLKEIVRISRYNGTENMVTGSSLLVIGLGIIGIDRFVNSHKQGYGDNLYQLTGTVISIFGGIFALTGIFEKLTIKYYQIGEKWQLKAMYMDMEF
jgi:hypothetical protein